MTEEKAIKPNFKVALIIMASLFFLLGFITTMNNSLISYLKGAFQLDDTKAQLVNTAFYGAYILSIPIGYLLKKIGYKGGVLLALSIIGVGFFLCYPGVKIGYYGFLSSMFVVAMGVAILQVAVNPYILSLGSPETAASRLTMTQALNSLATTVAPVFVSMLIVSANNSSVAGGEGPNLGAIAKSVQAPFFGIAILVLIIAVVLYFLHLPEIKDEETSSNGSKTYKASVWQYKHMILGAMGIFVYLGVEIGIPSFFPSYIKGYLNLDMTESNWFLNLAKFIHLNTADPTWYLAFYWGGLMVGRFMGTFILSKFKARHVLTTAAVAGAVCVALSILAASMGMGWLAFGLFLITGLFHSIMWPCIFNLASVDLGPYAKQGSGIICTAVIGGAILLPIMGSIQQNIGLIAAISTLFIYYAYIAFFAIKGSKIR
jgi:MFS transporter, FHS family, L-fucose permease